MSVLSVFNLLPNNPHEVPGRRVCEVSDPSKVILIQTLGRVHGGEREYHRQTLHVAHLREAPPGM